jgi:predicted nucleic acid-binding protein
VNFVLDSSLALAFVLEDEALWSWEVVNVLVLAQRHTRITEAQALRHAAQLKALPIETDEAAQEAGWGVTRMLAHKHKLSAYDASYLEIAIRRALPLGTLDAELRAAAKAEKIPVLPEKIGN